MKQHSAGEVRAVRAFRAAVVSIAPRTTSDRIHNIRRGASEGGVGTMYEVLRELRRLGTPKDAVMREMLAAYQTTIDAAFATGDHPTPRAV